MIETTNAVVSFLLQPLTLEVMAFLTLIGLLKLD